MVQEAAKGRVAILGVLACVEDVGVPEAIDVAARREREMRVLRAQDQKALVGRFHLVGVFGGPAVAVLLATGFELDGSEVERLDCFRNDRHSRAPDCS